MTTAPALTPAPAPASTVATGPARLLRPAAGAAGSVGSGAGRDRTWLVAGAAALWATDTLLRYPLGQRIPAATLVTWEHLLATLVLLPWLPGALRSARRLSGRQLAAVLLVGAGSSAVATILFTRAFAAGDAVTPVVVQKLQPVVALALAAAVLGERPRARLGWFALPALVGAWLVAFPDPLDVAVSQLEPALLALGAASLWAAGTVLGRGLSAALRPRELVVLRFVVGLVAAAVVTAVSGDPLAVAVRDLPAVAALAWIPGLLALLLYYRGLQATPASRATLAELTYPVLAVVLGAWVNEGDPMTGGRWLGAGLVVAAVGSLSWWERRCRT